MEAARWSFLEESPSGRCLVTFQSLVLLLPGPAWSPQPLAGLQPWSPCPPALLSLCVCSPPSVWNKTGTLCNHTVTTELPSGLISFPPLPRTFIVVCWLRHCHKTASGRDQFPALHVKSFLTRVPHFCCCLHRLNTTKPFSTPQSSLALGPSKI